MVKCSRKKSVPCPSHCEWTQKMDSVSNIVILDLCLLLEVVGFRKQGWLYLFVQHPVLWQSVVGPGPQWQCDTAECPLPQLCLLEPCTPSALTQGFWGHSRSAAATAPPHCLLEQVKACRILFSPLRFSWCVIIFDHYSKFYIYNFM